MIGKVPPDDLEELVLSRTGTDDDAVVMGPHYGEDAAAIDLGDRILVVSSDPISLAAARVGTLGIHVACNDVAVSGATPRWLTSVVFLPGTDDPLGTITSQLDEAASRLGVTIVGGHSEFAPALDRPLLSLTAMGVTDRFIPTGGARPGDRLILTKGAGIEGTAILATDFRNGLDVPETIIERAATFFEEISVIDDAALVGPHATAMHDPTEGGVIDGLLELAFASDVALEVERAAVPVRMETTRLCEAMGVDPLRIFGSGALLAALPPDVVEPVRDDLEATGIDVGVIGRVTEAATPRVDIDDETYREPVRDDLYALWE